MSIFGNPAHKNLANDPPESPRLNVVEGLSESAALAFPSTREQRALTTSFSSYLTIAHGLFPGAQQVGFHKVHYYKILFQVIVFLFTRFSNHFIAKWHSEHPPVASISGTVLMKSSFCPSNLLASVRNLCLILSRTSEGVWDELSQDSVLTIRPINWAILVLYSNAALLTNFLF